MGLVQVGVCHSSGWIRAVWIDMSYLNECVIRSEVGSRSGSYCGFVLADQPNLGSVGHLCHPSEPIMFLFQGRSRLGCAIL